MTKKYLVGIDAGTTGCKTVIFDFDGNALGEDYREYPCQYPRDGWVEQRYEEIIPPLIDSCLAAVLNSGVNSEEIGAVAFSSQAPLLAAVGENNELLASFISWQDLRGAPLIPRIREEYGAEKYYEESGDPIGTNTAAPKWLWLKENRPEIWNKTKWFLSEQEFLLKEWGAKDYWTDLSSASREGMLDVHTREWSKAIHDLVGIPLEKRAKISHEPGQVVGTIDPEVARRAGLPVDTALCVGAHDQNCCTFGGGAVSTGDCVMVMGTFGSCFVVMDEPALDPQRTLIVKPNHGMPSWTIEAFSNTSASSFRWYRDTFCHLEVAAASVTDANAYDMVTSEAALSSIGANGVTFLPFLGGASGARQNPNARAGFNGMSLATKKGDMSRAVLEGICFEMKDIVEAQMAAGIEVNTVRLVGGAAKSPFWSQMLADILGKPIEVLGTREAGCLGAAMYAGVGIGAFESCEAAADRAVKVVNRYEPNQANSEAYGEAFGRFVKLYENIYS
ncbi:FGGY family carbohydrate kinase [Actinomycetaceae bacterium MB13-C1-2]|nr:FGGY family carbohydrate kinase [Actinomycetaceae bacterium MB13-C1-2]